jgi:hypothetical protein
MELNAIQNLMILADEIRQGAEILKDDSTNNIVSKALKKDLDALNKEIKYLHEYMNEIAINMREKNDILKSNCLYNRQLPYWHEIKAKVDQNG